MALTIDEINLHKASFLQEMNDACPDWDTVLIIGKVNQYYFTGTMQNGILVIRKDGDLQYYVRQSLERAQDESPLSCIYPMNTYKDVAARVGSDLGNTYIETEITPYITVERLQKYFNMKAIRPADTLLRSVRAVKTAYELGLMERSGAAINKLLVETVPEMLKEGATEAQLYSRMYAEMVKLGHHGLMRFHGFQTELPLGQINFGDSSLYPTSFDGPSGGLGTSAAVPVGGNPNKTLKKGDLVFVDLGFGIDGYHTDKTQVYMFGAEPNYELTEKHRLCIKIEQEVAARLVPGAVPAEIYNDILQKFAPLPKNFMGFGAHQVKFLGHGIGLTVDEFPVIADKFYAPLKENMTLAIEPKIGIEGVGMVGVENTYVVTKTGGRSISGQSLDIMTISAS